MWLRTGPSWSVGRSQAAQGRLLRRFALWAAQALRTLAAAPDPPTAPASVCAAPPMATTQPLHPSLVP